MDDPGNFVSTGIRFAEEDFPVLCSPYRKRYSLQKGTKAPQAAGKIHTDFEKGFIMAEVMKFEDFKNEGSEAAVKVTIIRKPRDYSYFRHFEILSFSDRLLESTGSRDAITWSMTATLFSSSLTLARG